MVEDSDDEVELFIPSTNSIRLEARVYGGHGRNSKVAVILTHPYGRLGGSMHTNVVEACQGFFASRGFQTVRFNFRGVGRSTGWGTFTGQGELDDVVSVCEFMRRRRDDPPTHFIICGYSFGSVVASAASAEISDCIGVVAISYPYGVLPLITFLNGNKYIDAFNFNKGGFSQELPKLLLTGDRDNFTSVTSFTDDFFNVRLTGRKEIKVFEGVDHFWWGSEDALVEEIEAWMERNRILSGLEIIGIK